MPAQKEPSVHASAILVGARAVLIRGPAGCGKSRLVLALLQAGACGLLAFARLVADDRTLLEAAHGRLLARPPAELAGLLEVHGLGIRRLPYEPVALVSHIVDLEAQDARRLPETPAETITLSGVLLPRIAVAAESDPLPMVLAALTTARSG